MTVDLGGGAGAIDEEGASGDTQLNSKSARRGEKIGVIVELSPRTAQKHLKHIYQTLDVKSRTAAADSSD